jgi:hypothetical protein
MYWYVGWISGCATVALLPHLVEAQQNGRYHWKLFQVSGPFCGQVFASRRRVSERDSWQVIERLRPKDFCRKEVSVWCNKFNDDRNALNDEPDSNQGNRTPMKILVINEGKHCKKFAIFNFPWIGTPP